MFSILIQINGLYLRIHNDCLVHAIHRDPLYTWKQRNEGMEYILVLSTIELHVRI